MKKVFDDACVAEESQSRGFRKKQLLDMVPNSAAEKKVGAMITL